MALTNKSFADLITFTRASTATRVNSLGLIENVASGDPRFDYDPTTLAAKGLLIEEARTNLMTYSERHDIASWTQQGARIVPDAAAAPDGKATADKLIENTATSGHWIIRNPGAVTSGASYTWSAYVKSGNGSRDFQLLHQSTPANFQGATFNLSTGVASSVGTGITAAATDAGGGWWRCSMSWTANGTGGNAYLILWNAAQSYTGDGTSSILVWGAQLEAGAFATSYIPTRPTFTSRASTATYYDSAGVIQTAAINVGRTAAYIPINGTFVSAGSLLAEAAATNLALRSQEFDNASWTKTRATVTANAIAAPDGTTTADKLVEDATASNTHFTSQTATVSSGATVSFSVFAKAAERTSIAVQENTSGASVTVNLTSGTIISGSGIVRDVGGGFYRITVTGTVPGTSAICAVYLRDGAGTSYTGNGTSGVYLWGAQVETGSYASSYIPTVAATVTRSADVVSAATATRAVDVAKIDGTRFSDWFNASEGTLYVEAATFQPNNAYRTLIHMNDGTLNERLPDWGMGTGTGGGTGTFRIDVFDGGVSQAALGSITAFVVGQFEKGAFAFKVNNFAFCHAGGTVGTDVSGTIPTPTQLELGCRLGGNQLNGHIKDIRFYPTRLTNAELQALTA